MKRIALGIQYDGHNWRGWQSQPDKRTVQDQVEIAIKSFTRIDIRIMCAGRTDAGVHALEQVVHLDTHLERNMNSWVRGVNSYLPNSIAVRWAHEVTKDFHARNSAKARRYRYVLLNHPVRSPLTYARAGWSFRPLSVKLMREAAKYLLGEHDFSAFRSAECQAITPIKNMQEITIERYGNYIIFTFQANAFLHHMVRNLMGSLVLVGKGERKPEWIDEILIGKDRTRAAPTFMPDGLYLEKVIYDDYWKLPQEDFPLFL